MTSRTTLCLALGCVIVGVIAAMSATYDQGGTAKSPVLLIKAPTEPFKIQAVKPRSPYEGFRVFDRLPGGTPRPETIRLAPEPEMPNKRL